MLLLILLLCGCLIFGRLFALIGVVVPRLHYLSGQLVFDPPSQRHSLRCLFRCDRRIFGSLGELRLKILFDELLDERADLLRVDACNRCDFHRQLAWRVNE